MIRMLIPLVIIFLAVMLAQSLMQRRGDTPVDADAIDVEPIDPSTEREEAQAKRGAGEGRPADSGKRADDDIIDVDPAR